MEGHNRKSIRLKGYDYSFPGFYFVTVCTKNRFEWFGSVKNGEMILNEYGNIARDCWLDLPDHYANCKLDEFVIMPNHAHGIIIITDRRERSVTVPPDNNGVIQHTDATKQSPDGDRNGLKPFPTKHGLSEFMRAFKTFSSKNINKIQPQYITDTFQWQKSFHDRIIRNDDELNRIRQYIATNPVRWECDQNNPGIY